RARRRVHLHLRDRGRARRRQGRAGRQAAGALRVRRPRRAGLRGDRHSQGGRPRDRGLRPLRGRGDAVATVGTEATSDARGLVELDGTIAKIAQVDGERAVLDARDLSTRKINAELRWLLYEQGVTDVTILNPSARHSLGVGILTRCRITF